MYIELFAAWATVISIAISTGLFEKFVGRTGKDLHKITATILFVSSMRAPLALSFLKVDDYSFRAMILLELSNLQSGTAIPFHYCHHCFLRNAADSGPGQIVTAVWHKPPLIVSWRVTVRKSTSNSNFKFTFNFKFYFTLKFKFNFNISFKNLNINFGINISINFDFNFTILINFNFSIN